MVMWERKTGGRRVAQGAVALSVGGLIAISLLAGCGESGHDAPVEKRDDTGAAVVNMPDHVGNLAYKCVGNTGYLYLNVTHNSNDVPPTLVPHRMCPGWRADLAVPGVPSNPVTIRREG